MNASMQENADICVDMGDQRGRMHANESSHVKLITIGSIGRTRGGKGPI